MKTVIQLLKSLLKNNKAIITNLKTAAIEAAILFFATLTKFETLSKLMLCFQPSQFKKSQIQPSCFQPSFLLTKILPPHILLLPQAQRNSILAT